MSPRPENLDTSSLPEFFRELVREALDHQKVRAPAGVEFYLVNLLKECLKTEDLYGTPSEGFREEPLALLYSKALQADLSRQVKLFQRIGDFSLYISGFFPASLTRQLVDVSYYIQMGESAYGSLSHLLARHAAFSEIFEDLSKKFISYVDILSEVSEKSTVKTPADLLRLYETWLKTGSRRARQLLSEQGILPVPDTSLKNQ